MAALPDPNKCPEGLPPDLWADVQRVNRAINATFEDRTAHLEYLGDQAGRLAPLVQYAEATARTPVLATFCAPGEWDKRIKVVIKLIETTGRIRADLAKATSLATEKAREERELALTHAVEKKKKKKSTKSKKSKKSSEIVPSDVESSEEEAGDDPMDGTASVTHPVSLAIQPVRDYVKKLIINFAALKAFDSGLADEACTSAVTIVIDDDESEGDTVSEPAPSNGKSKSSRRASGVYPHFKASDYSDSPVPRKRRYMSARVINEPAAPTFEQAETRTQVELLAAARSMTAGGPTHEFDNDALLRMERTVRNHMDVCLHNISYELRLHEGLKREHVMLAKAR
ncbi:hypothetical protein B0H13DRAFT_1928252 [Mycena leptocephala]|nr:hypothetical protein B0H13DRAFT_1928252 [Mycena leptocephala]